MSDFGVEIIVILSIAHGLISVTVNSTSIEPNGSVDRVSKKLYLKVNEFPEKDASEVLIFNFKEPSIEKIQAGEPVTAVIHVFDVVSKYLSVLEILQDETD